MHKYRSYYLCSEKINNYYENVERTYAPHHADCTCVQIHTRMHYIRCPEFLDTFIKLAIVTLTQLHLYINLMLFYC